MVRMIDAAIRWRRMSPTIRPANGDKRPDRQRAEAVEQALAEVGRQSHARIDRVEHHGLDQDAGQEELQVFAGRTGERAAEDEGEQQREHDRRHHQIEELLRHMLEFQHRAPAEDQRVGKG